MARGQNPEITQTYILNEDKNSEGDPVDGASVFHLSSLSLSVRNRIEQASSYSSAALTLKMQQAAELINAEGEEEQDQLEENLERAIDAMDNQSVEKSAKELMLVHGIDDVENYEIPVQTDDGVEWKSMEWPDDEAERHELVDHFRASHVNELCQEIENMSYVTGEGAKN